MNIEPTLYQHQSVLVDDVIKGLQLKPGGRYLDATFGGGGHTRAILNAEPSCTVIGIDWDKQALAFNAHQIQEEYGPRFIPLWGCFAHIQRILKKEGISKLDGILADFGTSQFQIKHEDGFSFMHTTKLDMRMSSAHQTVTAATIVNHSSEQELAHILYTYGEEGRSRKIARTIVDERVKKPITTTTQLAELIERIIPRQGKSTHPATKTFQALRIAVNNELDNITSLLQNGVPFLVSGGRIACISFHSLEDRIVKQFFKDHQQDLIIITPKPITASEDELQRNRSSRSAKLRIAQKI